MPLFELEYSLCGITVGNGASTISLGRKRHVHDGATPILEINVTGTEVEWILHDLLDGVPQTVPGTPRDSHVDFYIRRLEWQRQLHLLPAPTAPPDHSIRRTPYDPTGSERPEGSRIRMGDLGGPMYRYQIGSVEVNGGTHAPPFLAVAEEAQLHIDLQETPARTHGYTVKELEYHFGFDGEFELVSEGAAGVDRCVIRMTPDAYALIHSDLIRM